MQITNSALKGLIQLGTEGANTNTEMMGEEHSGGEGLRNGIILQLIQDKAAYQGYTNPIPNPLCNK